MNNISSFFFFFVDWKEAEATYLIDEQKLQDKETKVKTEGN